LSTLSLDNDFKTFLRDLSEAAGENTLKYFRSHVKSHIKSNAQGIVTEADLSTEKFIISKIRERYPDHEILAEESGLSRLENAKYCWIIDPLDGTSNFFQGFDYYCVSIALAEKINTGFQVIAASIYRPPTHEWFWALKGQGAWLNDKPLKVSERTSLVPAALATGFSYNRDERLKKIMNAIYQFKSIAPSTIVRIFGAAALDLALTAQGHVDGFWEMGLQPWDTAAGSLLISEAGGVVTNFEGHDFDPLQDKSIVASSSKLHHLILKTIQPVFGPEAN